MTRKPRQRTVPLWKYRLVYTYLAITIILAIGLLWLSFTFLQDARGKPFEQNGLNCTMYLKDKYCCDSEHINVLSTNRTSSGRLNWTYHPDCYRIEIHQVTK